jgi:hypothetical protein
MNYKIIASSVLAVALGIALVVLCFRVGQGGEIHSLNIAVLVFAASTGWLAGILLSPYDPKEVSAFPRYAAAVSAFASGYLVSKADRVLEELLKPEFLFSPVAGFRLLAGVSAFAIALIITYVYRAYAK